VLTTDADLVSSSHLAGHRSCRTGRHR
jgi:hypothetical protein